MRSRPASLLVALAAAVAIVVLAAAPSAVAHRVRRSYAIFRVTLSAEQKTTATGTVRCDTENGDTYPAASATDVAQFSTPQARTLEFERFPDGLIAVTTPSGGEPNLAATGTNTRQSTFGYSSGEAPPCPEGKPARDCGTEHPAAAPRSSTRHRCRAPCSTPPAARS